jgi:hypothetical protein
MDLKALKLLTLASMLAVAAAACGKASPAQPSSTNGGSAGTSYVAPGGVAPADKALIAYASQPVFMIISNGTASSGQATSYSFEVATDAAFTHKVFTKDNLSAEQGGGVTHQSIDAKLPGNTTYYWHTKVTSGTSVGPFGPTLSFSVGPEIQVQVPVIASPAQGGTATGTFVVLSTNNAARSGPATVITYRFQVSDSPSFANLLFNDTTLENASGRTSINVSTRLASGPTYYWRVSATDASGVASGFTDAVAFKVQSFDINSAIFVDSPNVSDWPITTHITSVAFSDNEFDVDFDRRSGPGAWPDLSFGDGLGGTLQYTLGMCGNLGGQWYCAAAIQFWSGRELSASTPPSYVARNWFYDARWGAMNGYQPQDGEQVGIYVGSGNLRDKSFNLATCPQQCERSDIYFVTWHNFGDFLESAANRVLLGK